MQSEQTIAIALHGIEPATFERCALIRDWLTDHGIDRVTLLVIPARDLHPIGERSPEMVDWLSACRRSGDSIAQHGFQHLQLRRGFRWWAGLLRVYGASPHRSAAGPTIRGSIAQAGPLVQPLAPAWSLGNSSPLRRAVSPSLIRFGSLIPGATLRLDLHPDDLRHPRRIMALEWVLERVATSRRAITYQELVDAQAARRALPIGAPQHWGVEGDHPGL